MEMDTIVPIITMRRETTTAIILAVTMQMKRRNVILAILAIPAIQCQIGLLVHPVILVAGQIGKTALAAMSLLSLVSQDLPDPLAQPAQLVLREQQGQLVLRELLVRLAQLALLV